MNSGRRGDGSDPELPRENPREIDCMELALVRRALVDLTCINYARGSASAFIAGVRKFSHIIENLILSHLACVRRVLHVKLVRETSQSMTIAMDAWSGCTRVAWTEPPLATFAQWTPIADKAQR